MWCVVVGAKSVGDKVEYPNNKQRKTTNDSHVGTVAVAHHEGT